MKPINSQSKGRAREGAWALLAVMSLSATALMVLAGVMTWANANVTVTDRNNEYFASSYAAEAATEKVLAAMTQQYEEYGFGVIGQNLANNSYAQNYLPSSSDDPYWTNFSFSGGSTANRVIVSLVATNQTNAITTNSIYSGYASYNGLTMTVNTYDIIANAKLLSSEYKVVSTVGQKVFLATIPLFQFAIFYEQDMEIAPGANMTITGPVHGNGNIFVEPNSGVSLTFSNAVGAVGYVTNAENPLDPSTRTIGAPIFDSTHLGDQPPLSVPVGTNTYSTNDPTGTNIYALLQLPQTGQDTNMSTNLFYNKADLIIIVSNNNTIGVTSGAFNNEATVISNNQWANWLSTNGSFTDQRNSLTVNPVVLNVSNLVNWSATNSVISSQLATSRGTSDGNISSIYIVDLRGTSNSSITTNSFLTTNYTTNTTTTTGFPTAGTYVNPVTTNGTATTNTTSPTSGYIGSITNVEVLQTNSSKPASGTYIAGTLVTNGSGFNKTYTYDIWEYAYAHISSYTYGALSPSTSTNYTYLTNWSTTSQPGIVLSNGSVLPSGGLGLAIATPDPAYIVGNWNIKTNNGGSSDAGLNSTAHTYPSAIYADAVTILSPSWNPTNSASALANRTASSDTVNAAILTGNVPSNGENYSGGVENFLRFLENWSGQTLTYNGSLVCLFASQIGNYPWPGTGTVYNPPTRNWAFDSNFNNPAKQPPMMPDIRTVLRSQWTLLTPYTTSF